MDLKQMGCEVVNWIHVAQYADQWQALGENVTYLWIPEIIWNFLSNWAPVRFSGRLYLNGIGS